MIPRSTARTYREVTLEVRPWEAEAAEIALLELGADGTASQTSAGDPHLTRVVGYFASELDPDADEVIEAFHRFRGTGPDAGIARPRVESRLFPWREWAAEARRSFRAFQVTKSLTIAPPWDVPAEVSGDLLVIRPGSAFGIGTHATTRGCLKLIPKGKGGAALDVGTGTGVLALHGQDQVGFPDQIRRGRPRAMRREVQPAPPRDFTGARAGWLSVPGRRPRRNELDPIRVRAQLLAQYSRSQGAAARVPGAEEKDTERRFAGPHRARG